jgi:hypothetical protein
MHGKLRAYPLRHDSVAHHEFPIMSLADGAAEFGRVVEHRYDLETLGGESVYAWTGSRVLDNPPEF